MTDYSGDEFGRTVAIIVGILAGLALLVVFISFLTKACKLSELYELIVMFGFSHKSRKEKKNGTGNQNFHCRLEMEASASVLPMMSADRKSVV